MSSGFVSGGTVEHPTERDDEWRRAQAEIEEKRKLKEEQKDQADGKSLFEVLEANKAAKQDAFEEAARLKNQYRALDDDEAEFLDAVLEGTRKKEAEVRKDTLQQLDAFRRRQEEAEAKALDEGATEETKEEEAHWVATGRKRKKGHELLKGVKIRRTSSAAEGKNNVDAKQGKTTEAAKMPDAVKKEGLVVKAGSANAGPGNAGPGNAGPAKPTSTSPLPKPSTNLGLGLGYASSDEDD